MNLSKEDLARVQVAMENLQYFSSIEYANSQLISIAIWATGTHKL
mgnify:CR=1 FL=1